jgi:site-specific recombinase XerD
MSALAPTIEAFFTERLITQRDASPHTVAAYRDTFRLLLGFAFDRTGKTPSQLDVADLDAVLIAAFLTHLEHERGNSVATRNARLCAIRSLFGYAAWRHPEHAAVIQRVLAMPAKRYEQTIVFYLAPDEIDALLAACDRTTWIGRRDHALLLVAVQTGLRVSVLRHTAAMQLLQAGVDVSVIALWLGHENIQTTQIYIHADLALKERALARTAPPNTTPGRYRPPDPLLAFLEAL